MWRISAIRWQLHKQLYINTIGYAAAFGPVSERPISPHQLANSLYSPAATQLRRRKGHPDRQKRHTARMRLVANTNRLELAYSIEMPVSATYFLNGWEVLRMHIPPNVAGDIFQRCVSRKRKMLPTTTDVLRRLGKYNVDISALTQSELLTITSFLRHLALTVRIAPMNNDAVKNYLCEQLEACHVHTTAEDQALVDALAQVVHSQDMNVVPVSRFHGVALMTTSSLISCGWTRPVTLVQAVDVTSGQLTGATLVELPM